MNDIMSLIKALVVLVPFLLLVMANKKANLSQEDRSRQCYMPLVAVVFCLVCGFFLTNLTNMVIDFLYSIKSGLDSFAAWIGSLFGGALGFLENLIYTVSDWFDSLLDKIDLVFWAEVLVNAFIVLLYLPFKRIIVTIMKAFCKDGARHYETVSKIAYQKRPEDGNRYLKPHIAQGVTLAKTLYYASIIFSIIGVPASVFLMENHLIASLYYPVFSVIMVGEVYFFLDGPHWIPEESVLAGEAEQATSVCDYSFMRQVLGRNFGDKLMSDNTSVNSDLYAFRTNEEVIDELLTSTEIAEEAYGLFMQKKAAAGLDVDQNYLASGLDLLRGKSVVFNNPFYYDLVPYIFFPMNRAILQRKKVLIVLGRHSIEKDAAQWCEQGLASVSNIPGLWNIGVLSREPQNLDVGIVTRSSVHDLQMHENNADFFKDVEFVVLLEPSRLVATAQVGLNSLVRHCRRNGKKLVFCSADKNCDGLVDALSHILMTSLEEVSATNKHTGVSSYMCWEADGEHLQHRMLPNLSRYLGIGTELSFTALKNQISRTSWYGGDAFPVSDIHWIAKQYYYDLLRFASLPTVQSTFDEVFTASANMWTAKKQENSYLTVEDESFNMYEVKRAFSTRSKNQGFVNVISTDYLLKDYMAANDGIFDSDSKAIPYIVADYAHTERNVIYRLCLRLTSYPLMEADIRQELMLINADPGEDLVEGLWTLICKATQSINDRHFDPRSGRELMVLTKAGKEYTFSSSVIRTERKYSIKAGGLVQLFSIKDRNFISVFLNDLCSAEYIAEDESDKDLFLGTELRGHIFQKYLPGQFFTFGGKYYEMVRLALDGRVMVRRAADHINGRPQYRQVRNYRIRNAIDSPMMGDQKDIGGIRMVKQYADIEVDTPAYWHMQRYSDFRTGKKVAINGVPTRQYRNKQLLKIDFPQELLENEKVLPTIALLMNEVFRTLFAENQGMIVAVTPGIAEAPLTYSLESDDATAGSIYIIEDSQMDIGFLVSVERHFSRILAIVCDYLQWHSKELADSLTPPPAPTPPSFELNEAQRAAEAQAEAEAKKAKGVRGFFKKAGATAKKIGNSVKNFFKKLFKGKKKKDDAQELPTVDDQDYMMIYGKPHKRVNGKWVACSQEEFDRMMNDRHRQIEELEAAEKKAKAAEEAEAAPETAAEVPQPADPAVDIVKGKPAYKKTFGKPRKRVNGKWIPCSQEEYDAAMSKPTEATPEAEAAGEEKPRRKWPWFGKRKKNVAENEPAEGTSEEVPSDDPAGEQPAAENPDDAENGEGSGETAPAEETENSKEETDTEAEHPVLMNIAPPKRLYSLAPVAEPEAPAPAEEDAEAEAVEDPETEISEEPMADVQISVEPELATAAPGRPKEPVRKPYHQRYYLLYGGETQPENIDPDGALALLRRLGLGDGALEQARNGLSEIENIEQNFVPNRSGSRYCDFCGKELFGSEYEVLLDGRERCMVCGRTAVKSEKEFKKIFKTVTDNLSVFFGININVPISIQMVNSKKLHKELGKSFVPSGQFDGRVLGVAIRDKKGAYTILLENGSPRLSATMTMVHELTHIWQYLNWDAKNILHLYGKGQNLEVYEGMAKWVEIQYAYLLNEAGTAKREELITRAREDDYGRGFVKYTEVYPLSTGTRLQGATPFDNPAKPL